MYKSNGLYPYQQFAYIKQFVLSSLQDYKNVWLLILMLKIRSFLELTLTIGFYSAALEKNVLCVFIYAEHSAYTYTHMHTHTRAHRYTAIFKYE